MNLELPSTPSSGERSYAAPDGPLWLAGSGPEGPVGWLLTNDTLYTIRGPSGWWKLVPTSIFAWVLIILGLVFYPIGIPAMLVLMIVMSIDEIKRKRLWAMFLSHDLDAIRQSKRSAAREEYPLWRVSHHEFEEGNGRISVALNSWKGKPLSIEGIAAAYGSELLSQLDRRRQTDLSVQGVDGFGFLESIADSTRNRLICGGVYFVGDEAFSGSIELEFEASLSASEALNRAVAGNSPRVIAVHPAESAKTGAVSDVALQVRLVERDQASGDYRVGQLGMSIAPGYSRRYNFLRCKTPLVLLNGRVHSCFAVGLAQQLEALVSVVGGTTNTTAARGRIVISPRAKGLTSGLGPAWIYGAIGELVEGVNAAGKESVINDALRTGKLVDSATSQLLLRLVEQEHWEIGVKSLSSSELGLVGSKW